MSMFLSLNHSNVWLFIWRSNNDLLPITFQVDFVPIALLNRVFDLRELDAFLIYSFIIMHVDFVYVVFFSFAFLLFCHLFVCLSQNFFIMPNINVRLITLLEKRFLFRFSFFSAWKSPTINIQFCVCGNFVK